MHNARVNSEQRQRQRTSTKELRIVDERRGLERSLHNYERVPMRVCLEKRDGERDGVCDLLDDYSSTAVQRY